MRRLDHRLRGLGKLAPPPHVVGIKSAVETVAVVFR